jgi:hypothetical protein
MRAVQRGFARITVRLHQVRSSPEKLIPMRYAGEWKLPGGQATAAPYLLYQ